MGGRKEKEGVIEKSKERKTSGERKKERKEENR